MSLTITFNNDAFRQLEDPQRISNKPDYKKFTMRFNDLDLRIIDALAKRDGFSRTKFINDFIEETLMNFLAECTHEEALLITNHAEEMSQGLTKFDENFSWTYWYAQRSNDALGHFYNASYVLDEQIKSGSVPETVLNLKKNLVKNK